MTDCSPIKRIGRNKTVPAQRSGLLNDMEKLIINENESNSYLGCSSVYGSVSHS